MSNNSHLPTASGRILAVVVLYKRPFRDVPAAVRLREWLTQPQTSPARLKVTRCLIYDNSPMKQPLDSDDCHESIDVYHDEFNGGTRAAYLYALKIAKQKECPWILLLDHDTDLPENFLSAAEQSLHGVSINVTVCAVVPRVFDGFNQISPASITAYGRGFAKRDAWAMYRKGSTLTAIASGSLVRTDSLHSLLPIPDTFVLDYLDHWLFRQLSFGSERVVVSSAMVQHSLSVQSMHSISTDRYQAILIAEIKYLRSGPHYSMESHLLWHIIRTLKLMLTTARPSLIRVCLVNIFNILYHK